jgi:putative DNA primase/helicase
MQLHDAIKHLGGGNGYDPAPSSEAAAVRTRRKAELDAKVEAERRGQIADAVRWWRDTRPVAGTIAERYMVETRCIPRPAGGWPDCVRFLPGSGTVMEGVVATGALIVGVTTADGKLCANQRIYLDQDAQNIRRDDAKRSKVKLTAGTFLDGAGVVRLPGPADGPLLIVEGPETGLSVWVATGYETWIALGGMAKVALRPGRRIVICRDDDKPHSASDKAITKALGQWLAAKIDVVVATPWAERRGEGDFNDVIRDHGIAAVRTRIGTALNPGPPPNLRQMSRCTLRINTLSRFATTHSPYLASM